MHRHFAASAIALVLAASCVGGSPVAAAQIVPDTAQRADGTRLDTKPVANYGLDLLTGARCLMGASATCQTAAASADHMATLAGTGWSVSTSQVSIPANSCLNFRAYNSSTTASCTVFYRRESNLGTVLLSYWQGNDPAALTGATALTVGNRNVGGASNITTALQATYNTATTPAVSTTTSPSDGIPANGGHDEVTVEKILAPGQGLGITVGGATGALQAAQPAIITIAGYGC